MGSRHLGGWWLLNGEGLGHLMLKSASVVSNLEVFARVFFSRCLRVFFAIISNSFQ